jgi:hypothetical protein
MSKAETSLNEFAKDVEEANHVTVSSDRHVIRCPNSDELKICSAEIIHSEEGRTFRCRKPVAIKKGEDMVVSFDPPDENCPCTTSCCIE